MMFDMELMRQRVLEMYDSNNPYNQYDFISVPIKIVTCTVK